MPTFQEIQLSGFYHPVTLSTCEQLLKDQKPGTTMIRPFTISAVCFGISYVNDEGKIIHTPIGIQGCSLPKSDVATYLQVIAINLKKRFGIENSVTFLKRDPKILALEQLFNYNQEEPLLLIKGKIDNFYKEPFHFITLANKGYHLDYNSPFVLDKAFRVPQPEWKPSEVDLRGLCHYFQRPIGVEPTQIDYQRLDWRTSFYQVQDLGWLISHLKIQVRSIERESKSITPDMQVTFECLEQQYEEREKLKPMMKQVKPLVNFCLLAKKSIFSNLSQDINISILSFLTKLKRYQIKETIQCMPVFDSEFKKSDRTKQYPRPDFFAKYYSLIQKEKSEKHELLEPKCGS